MSSSLRAARRKPMPRSRRDDSYREGALTCPSQTTVPSFRGQHLSKERWQQRSACGRGSCLVEPLLESSAAPAAVLLACGVVPALAARATIAERSPRKCVTQSVRTRRQTISLEARIPAQTTPSGVPLEMALGSMEHRRRRGFGLLFPGLLGVCGMPRDELQGLQSGVVHAGAASATWFTSRKDRNQAQHALHGNASGSGGDDAVPVLPERASAPWVVDVSDLLREHPACEPPDEEDEAVVL